MTAMIGLPAAVLIGVLLGFGWRQVSASAAIWYAALAFQTADLARVGKVSFDGGPGLDTVHWWVYWALQPVLLGVGAGLVWTGAWARRAVRLRLRPAAR